MVRIGTVLAVGVSLGFAATLGASPAAALAGMGYGGSRGGAAGGMGASAHAGGGSSAAGGPSNAGAGSPQGGRGVPSQGVHGSHVSQQMSVWAWAHLQGHGAPATAQAPAAPTASAYGQGARAGQAMPAFRGGLLGTLAGGRDGN